MVIETGFIFFFFWFLKAQVPKKAKQLKFTKGRDVNEEEGF